MKYLCQIYLDEEKHEFDDSLVHGGQVLATGALLPSSAAMCVRMRGGKVTLTDGPFAETKEQVAGFFLIEARDLNEAIQIGSRIPSARLGTVEIRALAS